MLPDLIVRAGEQLRSARYAVAFTGAGISTPSGIPDFRSARTGLWQQNDPMQVASLTAFRRTPELFFNWLRPLAKTALDAQPNPAHTALAALEKAGRLHAVVTQNIDGLHQRAGSRIVHELHGSLATLTCPKCRRHFSLEPFREPFIFQQRIPTCPGCSSTLKPDIVLFEEMLPFETWKQAETAVSQADVLLVAGSSLEVTPAANLPAEAAVRGAKVIIVNFTPTWLDAQADVVIHGDVAEVLPLLAAQILNS